MTQAVSVGTVVDALEGARQWRLDEQSKTQSQIVDVDEQLGTLRASIEDLQQQVSALEAFRESLVGKEDTFEREELVRIQDGLFTALAEQHGALVERAAIVTSAESERIQMLEEVLAGSDLADKLNEYKQFNEQVQPSLAAMPESYRSVVMGHHDKVVATLRERVTEIMSDPVEVGDLGDLALEVVFAVDSPEGEPDLLVVVAPVTDEAHSQWVDRAPDLQTTLAARLVQGVYQCLHETGLEGAQVMSGGHRGLLALECDLAGAPADIATTLTTHLDKVIHDATELYSAKVSVSVRLVDADHLLPPDSEDGDNHA